MDGTAAVIRNFNKLFTLIALWNWVIWTWLLRTLLLLTTT